MRGWMHMRLRLMVCSGAFIGSGQREVHKGIEVGGDVRSRGDGEMIARAQGNIGRSMARNVITDDKIVRGTGQESGENAVGAVANECGVLTFSQSRMNDPRPVPLPPP